MRQFFANNTAQIGFEHPRFNYAAQRIVDDRLIATFKGEGGRVVFADVFNVRLLKVNLYTNITGNMKKASIILDANVLVAGLSSRNGASHQLLRCSNEGEFSLIASVPPWLEYEATLKRAEIRKLHGLSERDIDDLLNILAIAVKPTSLHYLWRPQLSDPGDEMVLETALNGAADALVTFNLSDFQPAANRFGLKLLLPADFLKLLRRRKP